VNAHVWENLPIETRQMAYKDAIAAGAMALFGEKYGDVVRVVDVGGGVSLELCGGTHVGSTGQIALFRFTHETGAAAGVRRIEALTGPTAYRYALELQNRLSEAAGLLKTQPEHVAKRIEAMLEENRKLERRVAELLKEGAGTQESGAVQRIGDIELHVSESSLEDRNQIAAIMDGFRAKHKGAISVLFTKGERAGIHVAVTDDLVSKGIKAGDIANAIAQATEAKAVDGRISRPPASAIPRSSARRARGRRRSCGISRDDPRRRAAVAGFAPSRTAQALRDRLDRAVNELLPMPGSGLADYLAQLGSELLEKVVARPAADGSWPSISWLPMPSPPMPSKLKLRSRHMRLDGTGGGLLVLVDPVRTSGADAARIGREAKAAGVRGLLIGSSFDGAAQTRDVARALRQSAPAFRSRCSRAPRCSSPIRWTWCCSCRSCPAGTHSI